MAFERVKENLERRGYQVRTFATAAEAADYLAGATDGATGGLGGAVTPRERALGERLGTHNQVIWHWQSGAGVLPQAAQAQVYVTSVNGLVESGEIVNIDGVGNRVSSMFYGHQRVYFVIGRNKLSPTLEEALHRVRNVVAPRNAQRLGKKTPCAAQADRCYDCKSPDRICRGLAVLWEPMMGMEASTEVLLVDEDLGY